MTGSEVAHPPAAPPCPPLPPSCFPCPPPGLMLREAIEDLEWTGGEVEFAMHRSPTRFSLRSAKQTSLEVRARGCGGAALRPPPPATPTKLTHRPPTQPPAHPPTFTHPPTRPPTQITFPSSALNGFHCHAEEVGVLWLWLGQYLEGQRHNRACMHSRKAVRGTRMRPSVCSSRPAAPRCTPLLRLPRLQVRARYKYKHLKAAFANVAQKDSWMAKVGGWCGWVGGWCGWVSVGGWWVGGGDGVGGVGGGGWGVGGGGGDGGLCAAPACCACSCCPRTCCPESACFPSSPAPLVQSPRAPSTLPVACLARSASTPRACCW